ncbi:MAG: PKD domain-containing protein, partial [Flavobacteriaceae bacterium]|nr:PKD domain-containing protein [Flavobacteriaceae bacterium]
MKKIYSAQVIFILLFALSSCLISNAQSPSTNGSSTNWNLASAWTPTGIPNLTFWQGTQDVVVQHDMNSSGSLNVTSGNSIRVTNGATLTISGNLTFAGTGGISEIIVDAGSTLIVTGNFAGGFAHVVTISGTLNVGGNYTIASGSYTQTISGDVTVGGNLENTANGVVNVSGSIEITGQLKLSSSGKVSGTSGYITYGSYNILCNGFAYLQCGGTNYGQNASCTTPPANGLDFSSCGPYVPTPTPTANFTPSATTVTTSQTISFTNSSSDATSYSWNFGDGSSTSSSTSPSHQYSLAGSYTVTLTATNSVGSDTATQAITVNSSDDCDTPTVLSNDNFNTDFGTWIDGGGQVTRQNESFITSRNGTQPGGGLINYTCNGYLSTPFVALVGAGAPGITTNKTLTSSSYDLSNYAAVTIEYDHFVTSMDNNTEGYNLQYSSNGGSSWATIKNFRLGNDDFENNDCGDNDARQKKIVVISSDDFTFSSQNKFRFFVDADSGGTGGGDFFLIDNIVVKGYNLNSPGITMEQWNGISGTAVSNLTSNSNYPNNPSTTSILDSFEIPTNVRDNYGVKVSGYIKAPTTGSYVFWIASDDNGELNLSTDEDPANKTTIATVGAWTNSRQWNKYGSQKSAPVSLTEGQIYYIEAFMKEQGGGDNLAVGWAKPGESTNAPSEVIPGDVLFSSPPQLASFTTDNNTIEVNNTVNFTNTSTGFDSYVWDFGDGSTTSTETSPSHQYTETGTYTVTLTATSSCGSDTATTTIAVNNPTETLFFENFEDENQGDTSGTDAYNTDWDTQTSTNANRFEVRNGKYFEAIKTRNTAYWKTQTIDISNYDDLKLSSYIRFDGSLDPSDYIKFQYKLDGGSLTNIPNAQYYGTNSDTTYNWNLTGVTGSTLEIWVAFKTSGGDEEHRIDNITLTAVSNCSPITAYTVTGDDLAYCSGNTQTTTIGLSDSDVGVDYQLLKDGVNEGAAIAGTG